MSDTKPFFDFLTHDQEHTLAESVAGGCQSFSTSYWDAVFNLTDKQSLELDLEFSEMASERYQVELCGRCNWWTHQGEVMDIHEGEQICPDCQEEVQDEEE